jgi:hypothetical protein
MAGVEVLVVLKQFNDVLHDIHCPATGLKPLAAEPHDTPQRGLDSIHTCRIKISRNGACTPMQGQRPAAGHQAHTRFDSA